MDRDELLIAQFDDKINQAADRYMLMAGDFLDTHQRRIAEDFCRSRKLPVRVMFYGGYEEAERCMPFFLPEYIEPATDDRQPEAVSEMIRVIRVSAPKGNRRLTHRDYLGSLLALGLEREVTGDILVRDDGADIIVKAEIADFIDINYNKAGRTTLTVEVLPIDELDKGELNIKQKHDTVASLRLDNVVAAAFALSRAKAAEAINRGSVSVNSMEAMKVDMEIREGDKITVRGRGKAVLAEIGGTSRKDRTRVTFNVYI